jgi:hypothetical protein
MKSIFTVQPNDIQPKPYPHVMRDGFVEPTLFAKLNSDFPTAEDFKAQMNATGMQGSRTGNGRDIYRGDFTYSNLINRSEAWKTFDAYLNSQDFLDYTLNVFGSHFQNTACLADPKKARHVDMIEEREELTAHETTGDKLRRWSSSIIGARVGEEVNDFYTRLDIHAGIEDYAKGVHCDRSNRLISLVLYFTDPKEAEMEGGELTLHRHKQEKPAAKYERHPKGDDIETIATIPNMPNRGVFFMCSNNSYHGVTAVRKTKLPRRFCYISLASRAKTVWAA